MSEKRSFMSITLTAAEKSRHFEDNGMFLKKIYGPVLENTDSKVKCKNGKSIPVHHFVLAAKGIDVNDKQDGVTVYVAEDFDFVIVQKVIGFLYTGQIDFLFEEIIELIRLCHFWKLDVLKNHLQKNFLDSCKTNDETLIGYEMVLQNKELFESFILDCFVEKIFSNFLLYVNNDKFWQLSSDSMFFLLSHDDIPITEKNIGQIAILYLKNENNCENVKRFLHAIRVSDSDVQNYLMIEAAKTNQKILICLIDYFKNSGNVTKKDRIGNDRNNVCFDFLFFNKKNQNLETKVQQVPLAQSTPKSFFKDSNSVQAENGYSMRESDVSSNLTEKLCIKYEEKMSEKKIQKNPEISENNASFEKSENSARESDRCSDLTQTLSGSDRTYRQMYKKTAIGSIFNFPVHGLTNLNNTCFMSVILQVLCNLPVLKMFFLKAKFQKQYVTKNSDFITAFVALFNLYQERNAIVLSPLQIYEEMEKIDVGRRFTDGAQHDAEEFQSFILFALNNYCNPELIPLIEYFQIHVVIEMKCTSCCYSEPNKESNVALRLPLPTQKKIDLNILLDKYFEDEILEWVCPKCKLKRTATRKILLFEQPQILVVQLLRFDKRGVQNNHADVDLPFSKLNLSKYFMQNREGKDYSLFAVVKHDGSLYSGHYTMTIKIDDQWFFLNDQQAIPVCENFVTEKGYILYYKESV